MKQIFTSLFLIFIAVVAFAQEPDNAVGGTVTDGELELVYPGYVIAFKSTASGAYPVVDSAYLDEAGTYLFEGLAPATYTFQVWPDVEKNSMWLPTYAGGVLIWSMALFLDVKSDTKDTLQDITLRMDYPRVPGSGGTVSGNVSYGDDEGSAKGTKGKPYKKASILLVKKAAKKSTQSDGVTDYRETDDLGDFYFGNVMIGEYYMHVDVPGLPMIQTYDLEIVDSLIVTGRDFVVTQEGIRTTGDVAVEPVPVDRMRIFPNPGNGLLYIELPVKGDYRIRIYNTVGKLVDSREVLSTAGPFRMDVSGLQDGMYFIKIDGSKCREVVKYIKR